MKKLAVVALAVAVAILPASTFAACPDENGPHNVFPFEYYTYHFGTGCASTGGDVEETTLSCESSPGHKFTQGSGSVSYSMTAPSNRGGTLWHATVFVDFSDPHTSSLNAISATVFVYHNSSLVAYETFMSHSGNQGSLVCERFDSNALTVQDGDTVDVVYTGDNYYSDTSMKISTPIIIAN